MRFEVGVAVYEQGRKRPEYTIDSDLNGEVSLFDFLQWTKETLILTANEVLSEEQAQGFDEKPVLVVDGRVGKSVRNVSPLGQIEFVARADALDIILEAYEAILYRSKVLTGRYKSSHFIYLNTKLIASDMGQLQTWIQSEPELKDNDKIAIVNVQPYARKLERYGITAQRSKTRYTDAKDSKKKKTGKILLAPNGTYFLTARAIKAKYKRNSSIRFTFISGANLGLSGSFKGGRRGKNSSGRPYLYPALIIGINERGTL